MIKPNDANDINSSGTIIEELEKEGIQFINWIKQVSSASINIAIREAEAKNKKQSRKNSSDDEEDERKEVKTQEEKEKEKEKKQENFKESGHDFVELFESMFEQAILQCHSTMIYFLVCNDLLIEIGNKSFENKTKNFFEFLFDCCYHGSDIIETLLITNNAYFDPYLPTLLATETGK